LHLQRETVGRTHFAKGMVGKKKKETGAEENVFQKVARGGNATRPLEPGEVETNHD